MQDTAHPIDPACNLHDASDLWLHLLQLHLPQGSSAGLCVLPILHPFCTWMWPQTTALQVRSTTEVLEDWCPSSTVGRQDHHLAKERHTRGLPYSVAALAEQQPTVRNHTCTVFPCTVVAGVGLSFMSILHKKHCRIPPAKKGNKTRLF